MSGDFTLTVTGLGSFGASLWGGGLHEPSIPTESPEHPILMKIGTYAFLCTLISDESQIYQNNLCRVRYQAWKGCLCFDANSKGEIKKKIILAVAHQAFVKEQKCWDIPGRYWIYATFFFDAVFGDQTNLYFWKIGKITHFSHFETLPQGPHWGKSP